ncbi:hypothetical protein Q2K19_14350 [Micromonospora soli]|uniref:hypothetical protein n=1 Tax=Micromonospora sp. NBRC 110009 TaxID=3061627 RepID=UPI0026721741|nr:hypothetical protein [Micromonospora sp. NBRC 110009]WKU01561.1 hypothetical protein Q2K19_14350 [Micromonospora sp. NBRC 110009]
MSETGQPGAATPGEHGDGTGRQDDLARTGSGWAPPATGWARGAQASGGWPRSDLTTGWGASSPRHGDLPAPLPGLPVEEPSARVNGRHVNGVPHAGEESPVTHQAPVSAPPVDEPRREPDDDRLVLPAQRPAPAVEQPTADAESGPARHASDEPPTGRASRWAEGGVPSSAPPALQVPPVGAAASGFEVPPGFHAPTADRPAAEQPPSLSHGWADRFADESPSLSRGWADRPSSAPPAQRDAGPADERRVPAEEPRVDADDRHTGRADERRAASAEEPEWAAPNWNRPSLGTGWAPAWAREDGSAGRRAAAEPEPVGRRAAAEAELPADASRSRDEPVGRRAAENQVPGREDGPVGRRARDERAVEWAPEPARPFEPPRAEQPPAYEPPRAEPALAYEPPRAEQAPAYEPPRAEPAPAYDPPRAEQSPAYEPPRAEPARPYEPVRAERNPAYEPSRAEPARPYEVPRSGEPHPVPEPAAREVPERPSWAGPPVPVTPFSAPPHAAPTSAPPVHRETPAPASPAAYPPPSAGYAPAGGVRRAEERDGLAYRPRSAAEESPAAPPTAAGPAPVTSGTARFDRTPTPAPTSAPPYAARRSAPEPVPPAEPVADRRAAEPAPVVLPQRVPAEPDVPVVPEPPAVEPSAETPELARIATHLRRDDEPAPLRERPEGFDVNAILDAVREVAGVRDAALRRTPAGAHSLRLDLADGADPAEVSRVVARLLQERMGLAAAPQNLPGAPATPPPPVRRRSAAPRAAEPRPADEGPPTPDLARSAEGSTVARPGRVGEGRPAENRAGESRFAAPEARGGRLAEVPADGAEPGDEPPRRRRPSATHRGRAAVEESSLASAPTGTPTGSPATLGTSYSGGHLTTTETAPSRPLDTGGAAGPRVVIDHVQVSTFGLDATVEVRLIARDRTAEGHATGPAVDGYVLRLCAVAAAAAVDELLGRAPAGERGRCFVEHAAVVPFGNCEVATVVVLLVCDGWVEQLAGSALVAGDPRQAVVRATLAAVNRRLEALLA